MFYQCMWWVLRNIFFFFALWFTISDDLVLGWICNFFSSPCFMSIFHSIGVFRCALNTNCDGWIGFFCNNSLSCSFILCNIQSAVYCTMHVIFILSFMVHQHQEHFKSVLDINWKIKWVKILLSLNCNINWKWIFE